MGIFVHSSLNYFVRSDLCRVTDHLECIFVEIVQIGKKNIIIGCIYRPPGADRETIESFNIVFSDILRIIEQGKSKTVILAGDFNFDLLKHDSHNPTGEFLNNLISFSYIPLITHPTRITEHSSTLIDNIFINHDYNKCKSAIVYNDISDHLPVVMHL